VLFKGENLDKHAQIYLALLSLSLTASGTISDHSKRRSKESFDAFSVSARFFFVIEFDEIILLNF